MKVKEKINLIKSELEKEIKPIDSKYILTNAQITPITETNTTKQHFGLKFIKAFTIILLIAIIIPFSLYKIITDDRINFNDDPKDDNSAPLDSEFDKTFGFLTTSTINLIYTTSDIFSEASQLKNSNDLLVLDHLNNINRLLPQIEMLLTNNNYTYKKVVNDNPLYQEKISYSGKGLYNEDITYSIYYKEEKTSPTTYEIECLVIASIDSFKLYCKKTILDNNSNLEITYYHDDSKKDYISVSSTVINDKDTYLIRIIKDDVVISDNKLMFIKNGTSYVQLENTINDKVTLFKFYSSNINTFNVEYSIVDESINNDNANNPIKKEESGNIIIDIGREENNYYVSTSIINSKITFSKPQLP